jgi:hypothetical protein
MKGLNFTPDLSNNTLTIRRRVEAGEISGPKILMAGDIFPKNGHPVYLPPEMQLPEAASPEEAQQMAQQYMKMGFDGIKLFTGAFMGAKPTVNMDTAIVKAAVDVAHAQGKPVFTHPQNQSGGFSTSDEALANTEQATRAFYLAFERHNCDEDAGFQSAGPS